MSLERSLRLIAGSFVTIAAILAWTVSPWFLAFIVFVGLNLVQSAFTNWCPMMTVLRKAGVPESGVPEKSKEIRTPEPAA